MHVFPNSPLVACRLPLLLDTYCAFYRAWYRLHVFPHLTLRGFAYLTPDCIVFIGVLISYFELILILSLISYFLFLILCF